MNVSEAMRKALASEYNWLGDVVRVIDLTDINGKDITRHIVVYDEMDFDTHKLTGKLAYSARINNCGNKLSTSYNTMERAMLGMLCMEAEGDSDERLSLPIMKMIYGVIPDKFIDNE